MKLNIAISALVAGTMAHKLNSDKTLDELREMFSGYDYSGHKHYRWANDPFYADPDEWIKSAPAAYEALAQKHSLG